MGRCLPAGMAFRHYRTIRRRRSNESALVIANRLPIKEVNHAASLKGIPSDSVRTPAALALCHLLVAPPIQKA